MVLRGAIVFLLYLAVMVFILWCVITSKEDKRRDFDPDVYFSDDYYTVDELDVIEEDIFNGS